MHNLNIFKDIYNFIYKFIFLLYLIIIQQNVKKDSLKIIMMFFIFLTIIN